MSITVLVLALLKAPRIDRRFEASPERDYLAPYGTTDISPN